jgi:hypothetical protein
MPESSLFSDHVSVTFQLPYSGFSRGKDRADATTAIVASVNRRAFMVECMSDYVGNK